MFFSVREKVNNPLLFQITFAFLPLEMVVRHVFLETMCLHCSTCYISANRPERQNTTQAQSLCLACVYIRATHMRCLCGQQMHTDSITKSTFKGTVHVRSPNEMSSVGESLIPEKRHHIKRFRQFVTFKRHTHTETHKHRVSHSQMGVWKALLAAC